MIYVMIFLVKSDHIIVFIWFLIGTRKVSAYLDPGSGSYIFQIAVGLFITISYFLITPLKRLLVKIIRIFYKKDGHSTDKENKT
ncbi:hypothetical protein A2154_00455 [Candidatus Gottesmanbacteria bacterium RBG_16_43_7]|uniref:Uncharacterized protein n=1 Tax=Candidatus Gottesmanbacteria bacterium RBG_16_43_7 TaxID=1798373 RepID=A0A1F5ZCH7_9BACT|nr:MAG: hypothetical protein A2154_00455 [Candidatus Gottesmanbacteria bacterium RBG_16_43_7]